MGLPLGWELGGAVLCLMFSGVFAGLTLGFFTLDLTDLTILLDSGSPTEMRHAAKVYPLRKRGNYLLCTLLIGNTAVNSALAILTANLFGGVLGFLSSTLFILYVGEIIPQSVCHKHGLTVGAHTAPLVYLMMVLTFPLSYPSAKVLDYFLGGESLVRYDKRELRSLVNLHGSSAAATLSSDETRILRGALEFAQKTIEQVMTAIAQAFMLELHDVLSFDNLMLVFQSGHSRIPVYERDRRRVVGVLFAKDLILLDPDDNICVATAMTFFGRELKDVFNDTPLDRMLNEFKSGIGHMAIVKRVEHPKDSDPYYNTIGIVTLEDVIEELIGSEIVDETDVYMSNQSKSKMAQRRQLDVGVLRLLDPHHSAANRLESSEIVAVASFLCSQVEQFSSLHISSQALNDLLKEANILELHSSPVAPTAAVAAAADAHGEGVAAKDARPFLSPAESGEEEEEEAGDGHDDNDDGCSSVSIALADDEREEFLEASAAAGGRTAKRRSQHGRKPPLPPAPPQRRPSTLGATATARRRKAPDTGVTAPFGREGDARTTDDHVDGDGVARDDGEVVLYRRGVAATDATLVINGRLRIEAGSESFTSDAGPWTFLAGNALTNELYAPDFTATVSEYPIRLLRISRRLYRNVRNQRPPKSLAANGAAAGGSGAGGGVKEPMATR